jgi:hypothetical protein
LYLKSDIQPNSQTFEWRLPDRIFKLTNQIENFLQKKNMRSIPKLKKAKNSYEVYPTEFFFGVAQIDYKKIDYKKS